MRKPPTSPDYPAPTPDHPNSLAIRDDRILPVLDEWLVGMFSPDRLPRLAAEVVAADAASVADPRISAARRQAAEARRRIDRHPAALEAGLEPAIVAGRARRAQAELAAAEAVLASAPAATEPLSIDDVVEVLEAVRAWPELLETADAELRRGVYKSLRISLRYRRVAKAEVIRVEAALKGVDLGGVGGGTSPVRNHGPWRLEDWNSLWPPGEAPP